MKKKCVSTLEAKYNEKNVLDYHTNCCCCLLLISSNSLAGSGLEIFNKLTVGSFPSSLTTGPKEEGPFLIVGTKMTLSLCGRKIMIVIADP